MQRTLSVATVAACVLTGAATVQAAVISLQQGVDAYAGHQDAQVRNDAANAGTTSNTTTSLAGYLGNVTPAITLRNIQRWDLSAIPENAVILSVSFTVGNRSDTSTSGLEDGNNDIDANDPLVELRTISATFTETTATWNNTFGGGMTLGAQVLSSARFDPRIGDNINYNTFASSTDFVAAVQAAVDSPSNLFNFALLLASESGTDRIALQFGTNTSTGPTVPNRPLLTIEYDVVPEPASMALLGLGGVLMLARRRDRAA